MRATWTLLTTAALAACATAPEPRPSIASGEPVIAYSIDGERRDGWRLAPELKPDTLTVDVEAGATADVCFITDVEEFCRETGVGDVHDLDIVYGGVVHETRIEGRKFVPAAVFTDAYIAENTGKVSIEIPEVYELVNVAIALTEIGRADDALVVQDTDYYARLMDRFADFTDHPFVAALNADMERGSFRYFRLKMNAYAFAYDADGEIQRSPIYDRTGFTGDRDNDLLPYLEEMRAFSRDTHFRSFYAEERPFYDAQIRFYREDADIDGMLAWLRARFPDVDAYDAVKIVFSPLVGGNQSVTWFEQGDFRELQPHVNFPYRHMDGVSARSDGIYRGAIVFTELNHGFINPTADGHRDAVLDAVTDLGFWGTERMRNSYNSPMAMFNEHMNWGLVALYYLDRAPAADHETLLARLDTYMVEHRGFPRFPQFSAFLVDAYRARGEGETIADLYPAIIAWFAAQEAARDA